MKKNKWITLITFTFVIFAISISYLMADQSTPPEMNCAKLWYPGGITCQGGTCNGPGRPDPATTCVIDCTDGTVIICLTIY